MNFPSIKKLGDCHKDCTSYSAINKGNDSRPSFTCKSCCAKLAVVNATHKMVLNSQLSQQRKDQLVGSTKLVFRIGLPQIVQSVNKVQVGPELKSFASGSNLEHKRKNSGASVSYGLLWKKKKSDEAGKDFRLENIILKLKDGTSPSIEPSCCLCKRPYCPDLMYICCERCKSKCIANNSHPSL